MSFEADLAVIELAQRITFDDYKQPVALGMVSNTKSLVTIFGHKILNKKISMLQKFEAILLKNLLINFEENGSCD